MQCHQEEQLKVKPLPEAEGYNPMLAQASSIKKIPHVTLCLSTKSENQRLQDRKLQGQSGQHLLCAF